MTVLAEKAQTATSMRWALQAEGAAVAALAIVAYARMEGGWGLFALLILVPDVFMVGYLAGKRAGATLYNVGHSYLTPVVLGALAYGAGWQMGLLIALIWVTHIGADRAIGYGLKYASHFKDTHLNRV